MKLPRVHRVKKGGKVYRWHRVTRAALPNLPEDHPDFIAAWAAEDAKTAPKKTRAATGSIAAAWAAFHASDRFLVLSVDYRRVMRRHGETVAVAYGEAPMAALRDHHIKADLTKLRPHAANARLKMWRLLCLYASDVGLSKINACNGIGKRKAAKATSHAPWSAGEIEAYRARWPVGTVARLAMEVLFWTAARTRDAVRLAPSHVDHEGMMTFRQTKTGNLAHVPWSCDLPDWAAGWGADRAVMHDCLKGHRGFTFLESAGRVRSFKGLSNLISGAAEKAGIVGKTAHGLRATRLTMIAEAGGSAHAIMAWSGQVSLSEAQHYTEKTDRKRLLRGTKQNQNAVNQPNQRVN